MDITWLRTKGKLRGFSEIWRHDYEYPSISQFTFLTIYYLYQQTNLYIYYTINYITDALITIINHIKNTI
jgi:hypothetical protein